MAGGTKFRSWLQQHGKTMMDASVALGIYPNHISNICSDKVTPTLVTAFKIERYTKGAVRVIDFVNEKDLKLGELK